MTTRNAGSPTPDPSVRNARGLGIVCAIGRWICRLCAYAQQTPPSQRGQFMGSSRGEQRIPVPLFCGLLTTFLREWLSIGRAQRACLWSPTSPCVVPDPRRPWIHPTSEGPEREDPASGAGHPLILVKRVFLVPSGETNALLPRMRARPGRVTRRGSHGWPGGPPAA